MPKVEIEMLEDKTFMVSMEGVEPYPAETIDDAFGVAEGMLMGEESEEESDEAQEGAETEEDGFNSVMNANTGVNMTDMMRKGG